MSYGQMTRPQILELPKEEQKYAFRANPQLGSAHYDCLCPVCKKKYSADVKATDRYRMQCPYCNGGALLRASNEEEWYAHYALLRAVGEQRPHSLIKQRVTVEVWRDNIALYEKPSTPPETLTE